MIDGANVVVVIPAYNESRWIEQVVATLPPGVDRAVVVDDCSSDDTVALAVAAAERGLARVDVLRHERNLGVGAAIVTGYEHAYSHGADIIVVMAGDGQMDPADLPALIAPLVRDEADYAKGDRLGHEQVWAVMPWARLLGSKVLSRLTSWSIGQPIRDSQCGYTALSRAAFERIMGMPIWPRFGYPNDLVGVLASVGARIAHVTVKPVYRGEQSGMRPWHVGVIALLCARSAWRRMVPGGGRRNTKLA